MTPVRAIDKLKQAFSVEERSNNTAAMYNGVSAFNTLLTVFYN